jgi:hypothetical protein
MAIAPISNAGQMSTTESVKNYQTKSAETQPSKTEENKPKEQESSIVSLSTQQASSTNQNNQASGLYNLSKSNFQSDGSIK